MEDTGIGDAMFPSALLNAIMPGARQDALIRRVPLEPLAVEAWEFRQSLRITDAFYVVAARVLRASLATLDTRLSGAP
ncbi:MAG: hypothetical protein LKI24_10300 [Acidipropionibacterium sp.]|nr:hypothetical protein [Acidipropionibacterium sp.]